MIDTIVYENNAKSRPANDHMIIFLADVAASSFPYAVRNLTPLTINIAKESTATKATIPTVHLGNTLSANHSFTFPAVS